MKGKVEVRYKYKGVGGGRGREPDPFLECGSNASETSLTFSL